MVIILLLASLNSCTNPWIYMIFSDHLCKLLSHWCLPKSGSQLSQSQYNSYYESDSRNRTSTTHVAAHKNHVTKSVCFDNKVAMDMKTLKTSVARVTYHTKENGIEGTEV